MSMSWDLWRSSRRRPDQSGTVFTLGKGLSALCLKHTCETNQGAGSIAPGSFACVCSSEVGIKSDCFQIFIVGLNLIKKYKIF